MTLYRKRPVADRVTGSLGNVVRELVLLAVVMVPPTGEIIPLAEDVLIHQGPLVLTGIAGHMCSVLPMVTLPPDIRQDRTVEIETVDVIGQEIEDPWKRQISNAHVRNRAQGLVLSVMGWGILSSIARALTGICGTGTSTSSVTNCRVTSTQTDRGRRQAHRAVRGLRS